MKLHPVDIANEIKGYVFFESFDEDMLLQIATMLEAQSFKAGDNLIEQGKENHRLFFLRSGHVEILVDEERVLELSAPGEVLGEMSVISQKPTSASVRALNDVSTFSLNSEDLNYVPPQQKDRYHYLFYKIYSHVMSERLSRTNEKAKLFEKTARQLEHTKKELEALSQAQRQLIATSQNPLTQKKLLFIDPLKKNHIQAKQVLGGLGVQVEFCESFEQIQDLKGDCILLDESLLEKVPPDLDLSKTVLLTSPNPDLKKIQNFSEIPFLLTRDPQQKLLSNKLLLITLSKVLGKNFFGIEKYLNWGAEIRRTKVKSSKDRSTAVEAIIQHFKSIGIRSALTDKIQIAAEELLMNALYDAPVDRQGAPLFNHISRSQIVELDESSAPCLAYAADGIYAAISVTDPFGGLTQKTLISYLISIQENKAGSLQKDKGGAGRGLHQIVSSSDLSVFSVQKSYRTEVLCLWDLEKANQKEEITPTFHYFFV